MFIILAYLQTGYIWLMPLLIITRLVASSQKAITKELTGLSNTIILFVLAIPIAFFVYEILAGWNGQNNYEAWAFKRTEMSIEILLAGIALKLVAILLLLLKKFRHTIWLSIVTWLCCSHYFILLITFFCCTIIFNDSPPCSWLAGFTLTSGWREVLLSVLLFAILVALLYMLKIKWGTQRKRT